MQMEAFDMQSSPDEIEPQLSARPTFVSRRQFLRTLGLTGLAASSGALLAACGTQAVAPVAPTSVAADGGPAATTAVEPTSAPAAASADVTVLSADWPIRAMPSADDQAANPLDKAYAETLQGWLDQNPGVTIERVETNIWGQQDLLTAVSGGVAPSIYPGLVLGNYSDAATRSAFLQGLAADVTPLIQKYELNNKIAEFARPLWSTWEVDGKFFAAPADYNTGIGIIFRRDLIQEAGLEEPKPGWTWEDFRALAKGLTKDGKRGAAMQQWGIGWPMNIAGFSQMSRLPDPQSSWNWRYDFTSQSERWAQAVNLYRGMVFEDQSVLTDPTYTDSEVTTAFRNGDVALISNNYGFYTRSSSEADSVAALAESLGKPLSEVAGWVPHPVGSDGHFGSSQGQVVLASFSPDLQGPQLDAVFNLFTFFNFGDGYTDFRRAIWNESQDVQRVFGDPAPISGITSIDGIPGTLDDAWDKAFLDSVRAAANIPIVPTQGMFIPAEANTGPDQTAITDMQSRWNTEPGNVDIAADLANAESILNQQAAGFTSSVDDAAFVEGARKYYEALAAFWQEHAPQYYEEAFKPWYDKDVAPALA
jgi:hypothetical protein